MKKKELCYMEKEPNQSRKMNRKYFQRTSNQNQSEFFPFLFTII